MNTSRLGEYLREARERAGLSLEQLAERTRVRVDNLAALEREELDELPADAYVRGFVKIVCRELRLPAEEGLALYGKLRSNVELPDEIVWSEESAAKEPGTLDKALQDPDRVISFAKNVRKWAIPLAAIAVVVIVALVVRGAGVGAEEGADAPESEPAKDDRAAAVPREPESAAPRRTAPSGNIAKPEDLAKAEELLATLEARSKPPKVVPVEPPEPESPAIRVTAPALATPEPAASADGLAQADPSGPSSLGGAPGESLASPEPSLAAGNANGATNAGESPTMQDVVPAEPLVLEIEAIRESEVTLILDGGGFPRKRSLMTGERKSWKADSLFVISASDAGAIRIILNGADLGSPGTPGTPLTNYAIRR